MNKIKFLVNRFDDTIRQNIEINVVGKEDVKSASNNVDKLTSSFSKLYSSIGSGSNFRTISKTLRTDMNNIMSELKKQMGEISSGKFKLSASALMDKANLYEGTRDKRTNNLSTVNKELSLRQQLLNMAMKGATELDKEAAAAEKTATAYEKMVNSAKRKPTGTGIGSRSFMNLGTAIKNDDGSLKTRTQADDLDAQMAKESTLLGQLQGLWKTLTNGIKNNTEALKNNNINSKKGEENWKSFSTTLTGTLVRFRIITSSIKRVLSTIYSLYDSAASYEEALNLYTVALGEYAEEGSKWAKKISDALYLDPTNIMQYTGGLYNLVQGLGVGSDAAYVMATNLTQLSYDMSSYLNIDVQSAFEKLQSAITGQSRAVASAGIAMQQASLQELAYTLGINKKVRTMSQAEKTYLRYIQILNSTKNMQGDLARTIITPENALRVIKTQFTLLGRAIGQVFIPIVLKAIPYVMALTNTLTALANKLANWAGYKLADIDYSNLKLADTAMEELGETATGTGESISRTLAAFDDLNVVESKSKGSGGTGGNGSALGELEEYITGYDMLNGITSQFDENVSTASQNLKKLWAITKPILAAITGVKIIKGLSKLVDWWKGLKSSVGNVKTNIVKPIMEFISSHELLKAVVKPASVLLSGFISTIHTAGTAFDYFTSETKMSTIEIGAFSTEMGILGGVATALGGPAGAIAVLTGLILGTSAAAEEAKRKFAWDEAQKTIFDGVGTSVSTLSDTIDKKFGYFDEHTQKMKELIGIYDQATTNVNNDITAISNWYDALQNGDIEPTVENLKTLSGLYDTLKNDIQTQAEAQKNIVIERHNQLATELGYEQGYYQERTKAMLDAIQTEAQANKDQISEFEILTQKKLKGIKLTEQEEKRYETLNALLGEGTQGYSNLAYSVGAYLDTQSQKWDFKNIDDTKEKIQNVIDKYKESSKTMNESYESKKKDIENEKLLWEGIENKYAAVEKQGGSLTAIEKKAYEQAKENIKNLEKDLDDNQKAYDTNSAKLEGTVKDFLLSVGSQLDMSSDSFDLSSAEMEEVLGILEKGLKTVEKGDIKNSIESYFTNMDDSFAESDKIYSYKWANLLKDSGIKVANGFSDGYKKPFADSDNSTLNTVTGFVENMANQIGKKGKTCNSKQGEEIGKALTDGISTGMVKESKSTTIDKGVTDTSDNILGKCIIKNQIGSPSALYRDKVGVFLAQGIADGLVKGSKDSYTTNQIKTAVEGLTKSVSDEFNKNKVGININTNIEGSLNSMLTKLQKFCNSWRNGINSLASNMTRTMNNINISKDGKVSYTKMPTIHIEKFEDGGYPTSGDLFFANENGVPEYITSIGNRSAVANQDQMVAALSGAIITAMSRIPTNTQPGITQVYIGNDKVYEGQGTYQSRQTDRYGETYIKI